MANAIRAQQCCVVEESFSKQLSHYPQTQNFKALQFPYNLTFLARKFLFSFADAMFTDVWEQSSHVVALRYAAAKGHERTRENVQLKVK